MTAPLNITVISAVQDARYSGRVAEIISGLDFDVVINQISIEELKREWESSKEASKGRRKSGAQNRRGVKSKADGLMIVMSDHLNLDAVNILYNDADAYFRTEHVLLIETGTRTHRKALKQLEFSVRLDDAAGVNLTVATEKVSAFIRLCRASQREETLSPADEELVAFAKGVLVRDSAGSFELNPNLFLSMDDIEWSQRTRGGLKTNNVNYVGDLTRIHSAQLLRTPDFGRKALNEVNEVLDIFGIQLGTEILGWPPVDLEDRAQRFALAKRVDALKQEPLGARFKARSDHLEIDSAGEVDDDAVARLPTVRQIHQEVLRKLQESGASLQRLGNQLGWTQLAGLSIRLIDNVNRPTGEIPSIIGLLYSSALELGSFLEMDRGIRRDQSSAVEALDADVLRGIEDIARTLAPWLRSFPTVRRLDDEAGQFLTQMSSVASASRVVETASSTGLIFSRDAQVLSGLLEADPRGDFLSKKAAYRGTLSVRNMVIVSAGILSSIMVGSVGSDFATKSVLAQKAGTFLAAAEASVLDVFVDMPSDIRIAISALIEELHRNPLVVPRPPGLSSVPRPKPDDD